MGSSPNANLLEIGSIWGQGPPIQWGWAPLTSISSLLFAFRPLHILKTSQHQRGVTKRSAEAGADDTGLHPREPLREPLRQRLVAAEREAPPADAPAQRQPAHQEQDVG